MNRPHLSFLILLFCSLCSCSNQPSFDDLQFSSNQAMISRGQELVKGLAACGFCHGETANPDALLVGGRYWFDIYGPVLAPNITPDVETGVGSYSALQLVKTIRVFENPLGESIHGTAHDSFAWLSDKDSIAIVSYLKSLEPVRRSVARRSLSTIELNTTGFLDSAKVDVGYVPEISKKSPSAYGGYLVDHVARCVICHNSPPSLLKAQEYLAGGRLIRIGEQERVAPGITKSSRDGIGNWSQESLYTYLKTGKTAQGEVKSNNFCPTGFYRLASDSDLNAIAKYLSAK